MTERRRWGKAGVRLTTVQAAALDAQNRRRAAESDTLRKANHEAGRRRWAEGLVVPCVITTVLDARELYGPEVDAACHAAEPDVDLWEAGKLYPRWDQLCALAELTGTTARFLTELGYPLGVADTSMRFHLPRGERVSLRAPVTRYPDDVVARCPGTVLSSERPRR